MAGSLLIGLLCTDGPIAGFAGQAAAPQEEHFLFAKPSFEGWWDKRFDKKRSINMFLPPGVPAKLASMILVCRSHVQMDYPTSNTAERKARTKELWVEFFSDPSQWWDNRFTKKSSKHPDFKHKTTFEALWIDYWLNPPWIKEKIAGLALCQIQSKEGWTLRLSTSSGDYDKLEKLCEEGRLKEALHLLMHMMKKSSGAPKGAFVCLMRGCAKMKALAEGKLVHALIVQTRCDSYIFLANLLIDMYCNCGSIEDAFNVFAAMPSRNVFSWTAIISAYSNSGLLKEAIALFQQMQETDIEPDKVACIVVLKACTNIAALEQGEQLHSYIVRRGFDSDVIVQTTLVDMYAKCGCLKNARELFDNMVERNVVSWNAMIAGYVQNGLGNQALDLYEQMIREGMQPNITTLVVALKACASISALEHGKQLHSIIVKRGFDLDVAVQTTLVDMYAKCGCLKDACTLFDKMDKRNVISWNAMIVGYAQNGFGKEALALYQQMKQEGLQANEVTYLCILSACSHSGLVAEGCHVFETMCKDDGVKLTLDHYGCMVDLLGRAGLLADAEAFMSKMPIQPDKVVWMTLLGAARKYVNVEVGKLAFNQVVKSKSEAAAPYLLLIDMYQAAGRTEEVAQIRREMKEKGSRSMLECSLD